MYVLFRKLKDHFVVTHCAATPKIGHVRMRHTFISEKIFTLISQPHVPGSGCLIHIMTRCASHCCSLFMVLYVPVPGQLAAAQDST